MNKSKPLSPHGIPLPPVSLYPLVQTHAMTSGSRYSDTRNDRNLLLEMLDANRWFDLEPVYENDSIFLPSAGKLAEVLPLWLEAFGKETKERAELLLGHYRKIMPRTCDACRNFLDREDLWNREAALQAVDHLLWFALEHSPLTPDSVPEYGDEDLLALALSARPHLGKNAFGLLGRLMESVMENPSGWQYEFITPEYVSLDNDAYPIDTFARLAYWVFNPASITEHRLAEKAGEDRAFSVLWIFIALHFLCALRVTDIRRLPAPILDGGTEPVRALILSGNEKLSEAAAAKVCSRWEKQIELLELKPNKTSRYPDTPTLKVFIPESLRAPFGLFLVLASAGYIEGTPFLACDPSSSKLSAFFGEDFVQALGKKAFSTRRANKSFLQALEALSSKTGGSAEGYFLARIARSHKGTPYEFSSAAIDCYLRDASFHNLKAGVALRHMFDRGIFGFLPVLLLENCDRRAFRSLTTSGQTQLLNSLGLKPWQLESICQACNAALDKADKAARELLCTGTGEPFEAALSRVMTALAFHQPCAKTEDLYCLRIVSGDKCTCPDRTSCIGCGSEIYTKAFLQSLMDEYVLAGRRAREASGAERERLSAIQAKGIAPVLAQFVQTFPALYPAEDREVLNAIVQKSMDILSGKNSLDNAGAERKT